MDGIERKKSESIDKLVEAIDKAYHHPAKLAARSFLFGLMSGLGATLGVALIITLMGVLVRELGGVPVIGQMFQELGNFLSGLRR